MYTFSFIKQEDMTWKNLLPTTKTHPLFLHTALLAYYDKQKQH